MRSIDLPQSLNVYTQASVSFVALTISVLLIFGFHVGNISKYLKEKVAFVIEFEDNVSESQIKQAELFLKNHSGVLQSSVRYQDRTAAFKEMLPNEPVPPVGSNPFSDIMTFNVKSEFYSTKDVEALNLEILALSAVKSLLHQEQDFVSIKSNLNRLFVLASMVAGIFFLFAIFFVISSIRFSLQQQRFTLKTMQLVGARKSFIWHPLRQSTVSKTMAALGVADGIILFFLLISYLIYPGLGKYISILVVLGSIILSNIVILLTITITTFAELTRYLEQNFYDLYEV